jgi:hypothetical protein
MAAIRTGDYVEWNRPVFKGGSFMNGRCVSRPTFVRHDRYRGVVVRHSYGAGTMQHTFSVVCPSKGKRPVLVKGRNLYPNLIRHVANEASPDRGEGRE